MLKTSNNNMQNGRSYNGQDLKDMFAAATAWLEKSASDIDALNVFPVPDGDTGTNMLLTMRSTLEEAYRSSDKDASLVAMAMARGALMGARGNSGVILSQILGGMAKGLDGRKTFGGGDFAAALKESVSSAYKSMSRPVEGTMLTVIREAAAAAQTTASPSSNLVSILESTVAAARESVARTPTLLPVLKEAGVVDAGGQGLLVIFEGALLFLKGETEQRKDLRSQIVAPITASPVATVPSSEEKPYGYCTEFLLQGEKLRPDKVRKKLEGKGESVIVVGDEKTLKIHLHTFDPGEILHYVTPMGTLHDIKIQNMDDQHRQYLARRKALAPAVKMATVVVVSGEGLAEVFRSLGASAIVPGGKTMNPSTRELLQAVEWVASDQVILLPNNKNVVLAARQAQSLTQKKVEVVPTESIPQGVAALLAFNYEADLKANSQGMEQARRRVKTVEIAKAVRSAKVSGLKIRKGQSLGFVDGELVAAEKSSLDVLKALLPGMGADKAEIITVYYGADSLPDERETITQTLRQKCPQAQVEAVLGGQPHYHYIISVE